jgi:hypothetical protein
VLVACPSGCLRHRSERMSGVGLVGVCLSSTACVEAASACLVASELVALRCGFRASAE